jgi:formamidopyrimidine-DNA glycosylase
VPELPEVETVASELNERLSGRRILGAEILWPRTVAHPAHERFASQIEGERIERVGRRAKYIVVQLGSGAQLLIHLRMTGGLTLEPATAPRSAHLRLVLQLDRGDELRFTDMRKFGRFYLLAPGEEMPLPSFTELGPEPLEDDFTVSTLAERLAARRGTLKAALLDQRLVAGLGNIYVDEALFFAGLHPCRSPQSLRPEEVAALHGAIVFVLSRAVGAKGTTFSDYRTSWGRLGGYQEELSVFRKQGAPCPRCGTPIERGVVAGRGTHWCPACQRGDRR